MRRSTANFLLLLMEMIANHDMKHGRGNISLQIIDKTGQHIYLFKYFVDLYRWEPGSPIGYSHQINAGYFLECLKYLLAIQWINV